MGGNFQYPAQEPDSNTWDWNSNWRGEAPTVGVVREPFREKVYKTGTEMPTVVREESVAQACDGEESILEEDERSIPLEGVRGEAPVGESPNETLDGDPSHVGSKGDVQTGKADGEGDEDPSVTECQASQLILCDSGKPFGGKHCAKKVKESAHVLLEDRVVIDGVPLAIPYFNAPLSVSLCGLHAKKYTDRAKELVCNLPSCYGRGLTCLYQEQAFRYCHLHMDDALEKEVEERFRTHPPPSPPRYCVLRILAHGKTKTYGYLGGKSQRISRTTPDQCLLPLVDRMKRVF